jgi:hypothetical protein
VAASESWDGVRESAQAGDARGGMEGI